MLIVTGDRYLAALLGGVTPAASPPRPRARVGALEHRGGRLQLIVGVAEHVAQTQERRQIRAPLQPVRVRVHDVVGEDDRAQHARPLRGRQRRPGCRLGDRSGGGGHAAHDATRRRRRQAGAMLRPCPLAGGGRNLKGAQTFDRYQSCRTPNRRRIAAAGQWSDATDLACARAHPRARVGRDSLTSRARLTPPLSLGKFDRDQGRGRRAGAIITFGAAAWSGQCGRGDKPPTPIYAPFSRQRPGERSPPRPLAKPQSRSGPSPEWPHRGARNLRGPHFTRSGAPKAAA